MFTFFTETERKRKRFHQSKLSFGKGSDTGQDEETERKRKGEGDGDERRRAGTAHCSQDSAYVPVLFNTNKNWPDSHVLLLDRSFMLLFTDMVLKLLLSNFCSPNVLKWTYLDQGNLILTDWLTDWRSSWLEGHTLSRLGSYTATLSVGIWLFWSSHMLKRDILILESYFMLDGSCKLVEGNGIRHRPHANGAYSIEHKSHASQRFVHICLTFRCTPPPKKGSVLMRYCNEHTGWITAVALRMYAKEIFSALSCLFTALRG